MIHLCHEIWPSFSTVCCGIKVMVPDLNSEIYVILSTHLKLGKLVIELRRHKCLKLGTSMEYLFVNSATNKDCASGKIYS